MVSIRVKLVAMYLILVFIVMAAVGTFTIFMLQMNENWQAQDSLSGSADMIVDQIIHEFADYQFQEELLRLTRPRGLVSPIEYYILDELGRPLATSVAESPMHININSITTSNVISAMGGEGSFSSGLMSMRTYLNYQGRAVRWMEYSRHVTSNGVSYILYLRMDAEGSQESINDIIGIFFGGLVIAVLLAAILGVIFAGSVNKPITLLTKKAKEFARGDLDQDIKVTSGDEIGQLTESFNNMAHELKLTLSGLENEKNKMEIVLHNVTDGVLAYDVEGKLIHANHVCLEFLGLPDESSIQGISFNDMLKLLGFHDGAKPSDVVVDINDRFINVILNYYKGRAGQAGGVVLLLQDLTKHIHLDNMRKEFVANVSHELRTPLTTIKSYAETLIEEITSDGVVGPNTADFLQTIDGETDRMTLLVNDLLELSRLDNKQMEFNFQIVDLIELLNSNVIKHRHSLEKKQSRKSIRFVPPVSSADSQQDSSSEEMLVYADHERINQVVNNIITNSLRYSGDEALVEIKVEPVGDMYNITIRDNGMGIPPEDLNRIFERFYRVDKARSRELGGTGLGLSISKDIIEAHGGSLTAESALGVGTCMTISLKKMRETLQEVL